MSHPQKSTRQTTLTRSRILETKRSSFARTSCPELCASLAARELVCAVGCAASLASRDELRARRGRADIRATENDVADEVTSLIPQTHTLNFTQRICTESVCCSPESGQGQLGVAASRDPSLVARRRSSAADVCGSSALIRHRKNFCRSPGWALGRSLKRGIQCGA